MPTLSAARLLRGRLRVRGDEREAVLFGVVDELEHSPSGSGVGPEPGHEIADLPFHPPVTHQDLVVDVAPRGTACPLGERSAGRRFRPFPKAPTVAHQADRPPWTGRYRVPELEVGQPDLEPVHRLAADLPIAKGTLLIFISSAGVEDRGACRVPMGTANQSFELEQDAAAMLPPLGWQGSVRLEVVAKLALCDVFEIDGRKACDGKTAISLRESSPRSPLRHPRPPCVVILPHPANTLPARG